MARSTTHILAVGPDGRLESELAAAAEAIGTNHVSVEYVMDYRLGIETALARAPHMICVQMDADGSAVQSFASDVSAALPETVIVATYTPEMLESSGAEVPLLISTLRSSVRDFLRRPVSSGELRELLERHVVRRPTHSNKRGKVVSFTSSKGGVGKSTVSVNTACALAKRHPDQVLLIDASLQLGVCASMLDLDPQTTVVDAVREVDRLDETMLRQLAPRHPCGLRVLAAPRGALDAAMVDELAISRVLTLARRAFEYVVVDTFPLLDGVAVAILDVSDRVFIVLAPHVPTTVGIADFLGVLERVGVPKSHQRVIVNDTHPRFPGRLKPVDVATRLGRDIEHVFPFDKGILTAMNAGEPYALNTRGMFGFGRTLKDLTREIEEIGSGALSLSDTRNVAVRNTSNGARTTEVTA